MEFLVAAVFVIGYAAIAFEHPLKINKAASALLTGVLCWTIFILGKYSEAETISHSLIEHLGDISGILFFLLGAMTIVELVDMHNGFDVITNKIKTTDKRKLLWIIGVITFFLSSILDNLTTAIVMVSLLRKLIKSTKGRMLYAGIVVIAANAGGAWSPIGDVTTTMLWIQNKITTVNIIIRLILPSLVCLVLPLALLSWKLKGKFLRPESSTHRSHHAPTTPFERTLVFWTGVGALVFVPVFKAVTHLPPFMGMMFGLGILWVVTEILHGKKTEEERGIYSVISALRKIDIPSVLFFLGILIAISALQTTGQLSELAATLDRTIGNMNIIVLAIGLLSAIVDNVPLVAAAIGMYDYGTDHIFWEFLAYCAGTGGSALIIGSAAGVAVMGIEKIDFIWYLKKISFFALLGYFGGALVYILMEPLFIK